MCDDIKAFVQKMKKHGIICSAVQNQGWGLVSQLTLPGGGNLGVYQPRHARPKTMMDKKADKKKPNTTTQKKKPTSKSVTKKSTIK